MLQSRLKLKPNLQELSWEKIFLVYRKTNLKRTAGKKIQYKDMKMKIKLKTAI